ncbi:MAG: hypothetical protein QNJ72_39920 [Pleurocapsa sp. MO_226.B13]|nr:hypothetical protein [Pleurocapsa sp. MO_226.B13]
MTELLVPQSPETEACLSINLLDCCDFGDRYQKIKQAPPCVVWQITAKIPR